MGNEDTGHPNLGSNLRGDGVPQGARGAYQNGSEDPSGETNGANAERLGTPSEVEQSLQQSRHRLQLLWEAAAVLLVAEDPDAMLRGLFGKVSEHLSVDTYFNFMVNEGGDALALASCSGIPDEVARSISRLEFGQAICGTVAQTGQPLVATSIQESDDPKVQLVKSFGIRAYACNPLKVDDRLIGTLSFATRARDEFDADELEVFRTLCRYVTVAYERLRLVKGLREMDRRKDEFLAILGHELRNPLAVISSGMTLIQSDPPPERRAWIEETMGRQVGHLGRLVDDLLDVSRITTGKIELRRERLDVGKTLQCCVAAVSDVMAQRGHELIVSPLASELTLEADPARVEQMVINLLTNAAKYTPEGGKVWLSAEQSGSQIVIRCRDTGVGLPPERQRMVFEPFVQFNPDRSGGGLGMGLALVKALAELHGGSIEVSSPGPGEGSEFILRLPQRSG